MRDAAEIRRLVEAVTARPGFTSAIGTRVLAAGAGEVVLALDRRPDLLQAGGYFHGGVIAGLADHAAGETLVARAKAARVGGTIGVARVEVAALAGGAETLCAVATATMRAVAMPDGR